MKFKLAPIAAAGCVILLTVVSAVVAGRLSNRWGLSATAEEAAAKLLETPQEVAGWRMQAELGISPTALNILEDPAYVHRRYVQPETGDVVVVAVLVGAPGPIAVHTPEVCYSSREYAIKEARKKVAIAPENSLWYTLFQSRTVDAQLLQVAYGWSDGTQWDASTEARWQYLGKSHLYKIQVAAFSGRPDRDAKDACQDFLHAFLPVLSSNLVAAKY